MSEQGFYLYLDGTRFEVINAFSPSFVIDLIKSDSGSKTYDVPYGNTLKAVSYSTGAVYVTSNPTITVNGSTVSWSGNSGFQIVIYAE